MKRSMISSRGLEVDFTALVSEYLTLSGNATWLRNEYEKYENAPCAALDAPICIGGSQDLSGKRLDNAPKLSYSLSAEYRSDNNLDVLLPQPCSCVRRRPVLSRPWTGWWTAAIPPEWVSETLRAMAPIHFG